LARIRSQLPIAAMCKAANAKPKCRICGGWQLQGQHPCAFMAGLFPSRLLPAPSFFTSVLEGKQYVFIDDDLSYMTTTHSSLKSLRTWPLDGGDVPFFAMVTFTTGCFRLRRLNFRSLSADVEFALGLGLSVTFSLNFELESADWLRLDVDCKGTSRSFYFRRVYCPMPVKKGSVSLRHMSTRRPKVWSAKLPKIWETPNGLEDWERI